MKKLWMVLLMCMLCGFVFAEEVETPVFTVTEDSPVGMGKLVKRPKYTCETHGSIGANTLCFYVFDQGKSQELNYCMWCVADGLDKTIGRVESVD